jgi:hypothetical protein
LWLCHRSGSIAKKINVSDRFAILRSNPHPTKAFSGEGRSCVIDFATLHELIDRKSATMPGARSRTAYFEDCRKRPKRQRGKGFFHQPRLRAPQQGPQGFPR